jgi:hypothetical protein
LNNTASGKQLPAGSGGKSRVHIDELEVTSGKSLQHRERSHRFNTSPAPTFLNTSVGVPGA